MPKKRTVICLVALVLLVISGSLVFLTISPNGLDSTPVTDIDPNGLSSQTSGGVVRFPATVVTRHGYDCVELFTRENFIKYNGDPKWAASARFAFEPGISDWFRSTGQTDSNREALVTGKMTFVRDVANGPCGIVAGQLFE